MLALKMRTHVTFRHPAEFVPLSDDDGILAVCGAQWFDALLRRVPGLLIEEDLCQEDWGIMCFARRNQKTYRIGLSAWTTEGTWLAHFRHGSFAWFQWFRSSRNDELTRLLADVHDGLASEPAISDIVWHEESEMCKPQPAGFPHPVEG
jgi:hypothetical protein